MARKDSQQQAVDYLSKISLDIKEKDLINNPPLIKKFLVELKDSKAENLALKDSLGATQDALNDLDKEHAVLIYSQKVKLGISIVQDVAAAGLGAAFGTILTGQVGSSLSIGAPSLLLYLAMRIISTLGGNLNSGQK